MEKKTCFKRISDIVIPDVMYHPYSTGNDILDSCFSSIGGIVPSTTILLTGVPGSGKSTLGCYIAGTISKNLLKNNINSRPNGPIVFISREMSDFQVKLLEQNLGKNVDLSDVLIIDDKEDGNYTLWLQELIDIKPSLVILDSIQKHAAEIGKGMMKTQMEIAQTFQLFSKTMFCPIILIGHCNKDGSYMGPSSLKHELDAHLHINLDEHTGERVFQMEKNRFGNVYIPYLMEFTSNGIEFSKGIFNTITTDEEIEPINIHDAIREYHNINTKRVTLNPFSIRNILPIILNEFLLRYEKELKDNDKEPSTIKLIFNQTKKMECDINKKIIFIGLGNLDLITSDIVSEYEYEPNYMINYVNSKEDKMLWYFIREFCHLFKGCRTNTLEFFQKVNNVAKEYSFLFSKYDA